MRLQARGRGCARLAAIAGLLLVVATLSGCQKECDIECVDGYDDTVEEACDDVLTPEFVASHGGFCEGTERDGDWGSF